MRAHLSARRVAARRLCHAPNLDDPEWLVMDADMSHEEEQQLREKLGQLGD